MYACILHILQRITPIERKESERTLQRSIARARQVRDGDDDVPIAVMISLQSFISNAIHCCHSEGFWLRFTSDKSIENWKAFSLSELE